MCIDFELSHYVSLPTPLWYSPDCMPLNLLRMQLCHPGRFISRYPLTLPSSSCYLLLQSDPKLLLGYNKKRLSKWVIPIWCTAEGRFSVACYCCGGVEWYWDGFPLPSSGFWPWLNQSWSLACTWLVKTLLLNSKRKGGSLTTMAWSWFLYMAWDLYYSYLGDPKLN